jgi:hypothetical protein
LIYLLEDFTPSCRSEEKQLSTVSAVASGREESDEMGARMIKGEMKCEEEKNLQLYVQGI